MGINLLLIFFTNINKKIKSSFYLLIFILSFLRAKIVWLLLFSCFISSYCFAQPVNDDPCNAIPLTANPSCIYQQFTNQNATATVGVPAPGCALYLGGDVWFTLQVPCNGSITIDTQTGAMTDGGMAIYSGDCNNLTLLECDDDDSPNGLMPNITASGLTPNSTIWIRVWEVGNDNNGTFQICVSLPPTPGPGGTCNAALPFCTRNIYTFPNSTSLPGGLGGGGIYDCLQSTPNPVWYYMQIQNAGSLTLSITQTTLGGAPLDVDFVLWGPFANLATSCGNISTSNVVDCSYSPSNVETAVIPNALAGEFYLILITNYDNLPGTITFQQTGGTTSTNCVVICNITAANSGPVCPSATFNLTASNVPTASYLWTGPNCFSSTQQNPTGITAPSIPGTYVYTVTATTPTGSECTSTTTVTVGNLVGTAAVTNTSCPTANDGTITVSPNPPGVYTYTLNPGAISNTTGIFTGLAPNTYTVTFVPPVGCGGSVVPNPVVGQGVSIPSTIASVNPPCAGINNGTVTITPTTGTGPYSFTLNPGAITNTTGIYTGLSAAINYTYTLSAANGCAGTGSFTLTGNSQIFTPASITMPLCFGNANGSVTFNPIGGVGPFQYSNNGGASFQVANTFNGLANGNHSFRIMDNAGCTKDTVITMIEPTLLTLLASNTTTAGCSNNDGVITGIANGGTAAYIYTISGSPINTSGSLTGIFTGLDSGNYIVSVNDAKGCLATGNINVALVDNMFLTLAPNADVCAESSLILNPLTNPETSVFAWSSPNAAASTINNPAIKNASVSPVDTSLYILHAEWGTCQREDSIWVNVLHKPIADAGKDTMICNISYAILRGSASNLSGPVNYLWSPAAGVSATTQPVTRVYPAGSNITYTYTLTVNDNYGCNFSVSDKVDVRVQPPVPANAGRDTNAVKGVPHQLYGSGGEAYLWSPAYPLNNAAFQNPLATLQNDTRFVLRVTDIAGCIGYDTVLVKVYVGPTYYIPTAFSPNSDGLNDIFRPIPVGIESTEWFRIFNRYGEMVYETNKWLKGWDGTFKGKKQNADTYVWIIKGIDRNGKTVEMKGSVTLVR